MTLDIKTVVYESVNHSSNPEGRIMMAKKKRQARGVFAVMDFLKSAFADLTAQKSEEEWILTPCTVNGEESAAIALIRERSDGVDIIPIFVGVTPSMVLLDSNGAATEPQDCLEANECNCGSERDPRRLLH